MSAEGQALIGRLGLAAIREAGWRPRAVGGLTMGADPVAYAIAAASWGTDLVIDAFSVRKEAKAHGTGRQIEGNFRAGDEVVVVEDVITSGGSAQQGDRGGGGGRRAGAGGAGGGGPGAGRVGGVGRRRPTSSSSHYCFRTWPQSHGLHGRLTAPFAFPGVVSQNGPIASQSRPSGAGQGPRTLFNLRTHRLPLSPRSRARREADGDRRASEPGGGHAVSPSHTDRPVRHASRRPGRGGRGAATQADLPAPPADHERLCPGPRYDHRVGGAGQGQVFPLDAAAAGDSGLPARGHGEGGETRWCGSRRWRAPRGSRRMCSRTITG